MDLVDKLTDLAINEINLESDILSAKMQFNLYLRSNESEWENFVIAKKNEYLEILDSMDANLTLMFAPLIHNQGDNLNYIFISRDYSPMDEFFHLIFNSEIFSSNITPLDLKKSKHLSSITRNIEDLRWVKNLIKIIPILLHYMRLQEIIKTSQFKMSIDKTITRESSFLKFNNGRILNLKERFYFLGKLTGIDNKIRSFDIPNEEKCQIISYLMHCNPKNAEQLLNGTYDGKFREKEINKFLFKYVQKE